MNISIIYRQAGGYTQPTYHSPESNGKRILGSSLGVIGQPTIPHSRHLYLYMYE